MKSEAKPTNLTKRVVESFKEKFLSGELKPGDTLPSERDLAEQLKVSRTIIREAIIALTVMGLIEKQQGKRATVCAPSAESIFELFSFVIPLDQSNILNLFELREVFEPYCANLATKRATPNELQTIGQHLHKMGNSIDDVEAFLAADHEFHRSIILTTHNEIIITFYNFFKPLFKSLYEKIAYIQQETSSHEKVYQAMLRGNSEEAAERMRELTVEAKVRYIKVISAEA